MKRSSASRPRLPPRSSLRPDMGRGLFESTEHSKVHWRVVVGALVLLLIVAFIWSRNRIDLPAEYRSLYASIAEETPLISNVYDVYLDEDRNSLIYVKEGCSTNDLSEFFLHLTPAHQRDLPDHRRPSGFDNLDFGFYTYGLRVDGNCIIDRNIPEYDIIKISTGQYRGTGDLITNLWNEEADIG